MYADICLPSSFMSNEKWRFFLLLFQIPDSIQTHQRQQYIIDYQSCWVWLCRLLTAQGWEVSGGWSPAYKSSYHLDGLGKSGPFLSLHKRLYELAVALKITVKNKAGLWSKKCWPKSLINALPSAHCSHCCLKVFPMIFFNYKNKTHFYKQIQITEK